MKHHSFLSCLVVILSSLGVAELRADGSNVDPDPAVTITGNHVVVNDDDADHNHDWDVNQRPIANDPLHGGDIHAGGVGVDEPKLVEFTINASMSGDKKGKLIVTESGTGYKKWKDSTKTEKFEFKSSYEVTSSGKEIKFWVEGTDTTTSFNTNSFKAVCAVGGDSSSAEIRYGITRADADVDSDNNRGLVADFTANDDKIEFSPNSSVPGKFVISTAGDVDNDGVADDLDGLGLSGIGGSNSVAGLKLVPMKIALEAPYSPTRAKVAFDYPASVPRVGGGIENTGSAGSNSYRISQRGIRLWTVENRSNANDVTTSGGQFIPSNVPIPWGNLPSDGIIYVEYVNIPGNVSSSKEDIIYTIQEEIPNQDPDKQQKGYIQIDDKVNERVYLTEKKSPDAVCVSLIPSLKVDASIAPFANVEPDLPEDESSAPSPHETDPGSVVIAPVQGHAFSGTRSRLTLSVKGSAKNGEYRLKAESLANVAIYENAEGGEPIPMNDLSLVWPATSFANPVILYVGASIFTTEQPAQVGNLVFSYHLDSSSGGASSTQDTVKVTIEPTAIDAAIVPFVSDPNDLPDDGTVNASQPHDMDPGSLVLAPVLMAGQTTPGTRSRLTLDVVASQFSSGTYTLAAAGLPDIVFYTNATGDEESNLTWTDADFAGSSKVTLYVGSRTMNPEATAQIGALTFTYTRAPSSDGITYNIEDVVKVTLDPLAAKVTIEGDHVVVNDDDANDNQIWDKDDSPVIDEGLKGGSSHPEPLDEPLLQKFSIKPRYVPGRTCTLKITKEDVVEQEGEHALVKIWQDEGKVTPGPGFVFGQEIPITEYDKDGIVFWVEGLRASVSLNFLGFDAEYTVESAGVEVADNAEIRYGVTQADIDVDSDNSVALTEVFTDKDDKEEFSPNTELPGKFLIENRSDVDSNGVLDIFERIGLPNTGVIGDGIAADNLIPMVVSLKSPYYPATATIKLDYDASAPRLEGDDKGIALDGIPDRNGKQKYKIIKRGIRVWTKKASERTSGKDVSENGQFVPQGKEVAWSLLFDNNESITREKTLWIEYVELPDVENTYSKEDIIYTISDEVSGAFTKGYIQNGADESQRTYLAEKESPDGVCVSLLQVKIASSTPPHGFPYIPQKVDNVISTWPEESVTLLAQAGDLTIEELDNIVDVTWTVGGGISPPIRQGVSTTLSGFDDNISPVKVTADVYGAKFNVIIDVPNVGDFSEAFVSSTNPLAAITVYESATKAIAWAATFAGRDQRNALQHSFWNAHIASSNDYSLALLFTTAHEYTNKESGGLAVDSTMDLHNNFIGSGVVHRYNGTYVPNEEAIKQDLLEKYENGDLYIIDEDDSLQIIKSNGEKIYKK